MASPPCWATTRTPPTSTSPTRCAAGAGLCDVDAVRVLVDEGPARVTELIALGAVFDREADGTLQLAREGGHSVARVVHAGGAATGMEIERALVGGHADHRRVGHGEVARRRPAHRERRVPRRRRPHAQGERVEVRATHTLLATGGAGQLFAVTTNPEQATGDGIAMALARRRSPWPTSSSCSSTRRRCITPPCRGRCCREALRGHGALLRDKDGKQFVDELSPRDVVSRAMSATMADARRRSPVARRDRPRAVRRTLPDDHGVAHRRRSRCRDRLAADRAGRALPVGRCRHRSRRARRQSRVCGPRARPRASVCTAPTGWRRTRCSTAWCSRRASSKRSKPADVTPEATGAMRAVLEGVGRHPRSTHRSPRDGARRRARRARPRQDPRRAAAGDDPWRWRAAQRRVARRDRHRTVEPAGRPSRRTCATTNSS